MTHKVVGGAVCCFPHAYQQYGDVVVFQLMLFQKSAGLVAPVRVGGTHTSVAPSRDLGQRLVFLAAPACEQRVRNQCGWLPRSAGRVKDARSAPWSDARASFAQAHVGHTFDGHAEWE